MNSVIYWLLISVGAQAASGHPTVLVAKFEQQAQCEETRTAIFKSYENVPRLVCVPAKGLVRP